jgi:FG-GAP repeat
MTVLDQKQTGGQLRDLPSSPLPSLETSCDGIMLENEGIMHESVDITQHSSCWCCGSKVLGRRRKITLVAMIAASLVAIISISIAVGVATNSRFSPSSPDQSSSSSWVQVGDDIDGERSGDFSGYSVSLSNDGSVLAVGGFGNLDFSGNARVWKLSTDGIGNFSWAQMGSDLVGTAQGDQFGVAVSLSSDGAILAVGAHLNSDAGERSGQVRVFQLISTSTSAVDWAQIGDDLNGEALGDQFGGAVSLSSTGRTVAIGSRFNDNASSMNAGHVRVYDYDDANGWALRGPEINGVAGEQLGFSVALTGDGNKIAVGSVDQTVQLFWWNVTANIWLAVGTVTTGTTSSFLSVSISADGNVLAVGDDEKKGAGRILVYQLNGEGSADQLGEALSGVVLALSGDGRTVATGGSNGGLEFVQVFRWNGHDWRQVGYDVQGESVGDQALGLAVSLNTDGSVVAIGARSNDEKGSDAGHVRVFQVMDM